MNIRKPKIERFKFSGNLILSTNLAIFSTLTGEKEDKVFVEHKGYIFVRHYDRGDKTFWRCNQMKAGKRCTARVATGGDSILERGEHSNHSP